MEQFATTVVFPKRPHLPMILEDQPEYREGSGGVAESGSRRTLIKRTPSVAVLDDTETAQVNMYAVYRMLLHELMYRWFYSFGRKVEGWWSSGTATIEAVRQLPQRKFGSLTSNVLKLLTLPH